MKKFLLFTVAAMMVTMLSAPVAYADKLSPMEPDRPATEVGGTDTDSSIVPAPQTGETGLGGIEALTLAAAASTVCGAVTLVKAKKQAGSAR
ncbi:hypothetical protein [uncultured Dysosmobacter sp.]|uniref:hypothetical protein n=1 Tax=uncultured Dysosmobacter sp. TaxID=2591384 RepID=UPI002612DABD|nr:hypothetical protein [uncultured Dysosmobacter sp.]